MASQVVGDADCFTINSFVRGHHVYQSKWTPFIGQCLVIKREPDNPHDKFAVSVICEGDVVGHLPRSIAKNVSYFLSHHGNVGFCETTGEKCNRGGGLGVEIPCQYKFYGQSLFIKRLKELLH